MAKPELRFPEFTDEWEESVISKIAIIIDGDRGKNYPKDSEFQDEGYCLFLNAKNVTSDGLKFVENMFISQEKDLLLKKGKLQRDDIVITSRGTVGNIGFYSQNIEYEHMRINSGMLIIRTNKINPQYLYMHMKSAEFARQIKIITSGNAQPQLTVANFNQLRVHYSSEKEQQKIADFLSSVDDMIQIQEEKISALEEQKKGVMQKIFSREVRFKADDGSEYPEWEVKRIDEVCQIVGGGTPSTDNEELWNGNIQWFTPAEVGKNKYVYKSKKTITEKGIKESSAKILPKGAILLSTRATIGEMSITGMECCTNQGFQSLIVNENYSNEYIYYLQCEIKKYALNNSSGSTFLEVSKKNLAKCKLSIPCIEEQGKIVDCLSTFDEIIQINRKKLEIWKDIKKGLLQQMFV